MECYTRYTLYVSKISSPSNTPRYSPFNKAQLFFIRKQKEKQPYKEKGKKENNPNIRQNIKEISKEKVDETHTDIYTNTKPLQQDSWP